MSEKHERQPLRSCGMKCGAAVSGIMTVVSSCAVAAEPLLAPPTDYGRSFIISAGAAHGNAPLFWIESRCRIEDPAAKIVRDYYPCGACKSENTFGTQDLFLIPNYDFLPVFAEGEAVIFRRYASAAISRHPYRQVTSPPWGPIQPRLRPVKARVLADGAAIAAAVAAGLPLIGQVEIRDTSSGRRALLEFPVKTMNRGTDGKSWQVDTGPIVLPDLKAAPDQWGNTLRLAFIAYNTAAGADFVVEAPTPLLVDGKEVARVHHYSETNHLATINQVLAVEIE